MNVTNNIQGALFEDAFPLGSIFCTPGVIQSVPPHESQDALYRHARGDWGDVCGQDWQENEQALEEGWRLFSQYRTQAGVKFWIITEADRSVTTILLPNEY